MELKWEEPPRTSGRNNSDYDLVMDVLIQSPGKWAVLFEGSPGDCSTKRQAFRRAAERRTGVAFEIVNRRGKVYGRMIAEPPK